MISDGSKKGELRKAECEPAVLYITPSGLEVSEVTIVSGNVYPKDSNRCYVKGGTQTRVEFSSQTDYPCVGWKPEENRLREQCDSGIINTLTSAADQRSEDQGILTSEFLCLLTKDQEERIYIPEGSIGAGEAKRWIEPTEKEKRLILICDAKGPQVTGTIPEMIREYTELIFTASDHGSGVLEKSFSLVLKNRTNGQMRTYTSSGDQISCVLDPDNPFAEGNLEWEISVSDRVGNQTIYNGRVLVKKPKTEEEMLREIRTRIL
ncbi:MAG: hypothetical protein ACI4DV_02605 [Lachnospiraceae bacterium]